jgi:hypothetical protein
MKSIQRVSVIISLAAIALAVCSLSTFSAKAQESALSIMTKQWEAFWISVPQTVPENYGVYYFRKNFEMAAIPDSLPVYVSADNRYKLFVNEKTVSIGPARGDVQHWYYETVDLSPYLHPGHNVIAAQVWNEGESRAEANVSLRTGFILQGGSPDAKMLNTDDTWKCIKDYGYSPNSVVMPTFYVAGPGEQVDMHKHVSGWNSRLYDDSVWPSAVPVIPGTPKNMVSMAGFGVPAGWQLLPSPLPQMELKKQRLALLRKCEGIAAPASFPAEKSVVVIPPNTKAEFILDQTFLTNAYLTLRFSRGDNSAIVLGYQESLFTEYPAKGNRNDIAGKVFLGRKDSIISNGKDAQEFTTLSWRTYRYVQLSVTTKDEPLLLEDIYGTFTGFPFELKASLDTDDALLQKIFDIGWRTARLCAVETYMDCPYYEQLQYIGDSRIQSLVSLFNSGDDRLVRNFLNQADYSRQPEGVTMSRYPTSNAQFIPPFSLWYIGTLYDYMMYGNDRSFIKQKLVGVRQILDYFSRFQETGGSVKNLPLWNFTDWVYVPGWIDGVAVAGKDGYSALIDLQLLWAYELAAEMEKELGMESFAALYGQCAEKLKDAIQRKYWDEKRGLYADRSERDLFSQHTNSLAILTGVISGAPARRIGEQLLTDTALAPASIYFKYYLHQALTKVGFGDDYLNWMDKWKENIDMGLTTWAETSDLNETRSDCHAWGASPNIEFFRIILGIDSDAPGFSKIKIEPHLGNIQKIAGEMPHPKGKIAVSYTQNGRHLNAVINIPSQTSGVFVWKGKSYGLKTGENKIDI